MPKGNTITTKSLQRVGKGVLKTQTFFLEVSVEKKVGREGYYMFVEGKDKDISRLTAEEVWDLLSDYFQAELIEDKNYKHKL